MAALPADDGSVLTLRLLRFLLELLSEMGCEPFMTALSWASGIAIILYKCLRDKDFKLWE